MIEILLVGAILLFIVLYWTSNGKDMNKFIKQNADDLFDKLAPYSYKEMRNKIKDLGLNYTTKQYVIQIIIFAVVAAILSYLYFYNLIICIIYAALAVASIPYITYLRCKRQYSEYIFEQVQVYCTNTIMEFATTEAFIKSLEGVVESGVLEEPILSDVKIMIKLSYEKGDVNDSIQYMNKKYPYYMVKNMHQLFLQVTKEGAKDTEGTFDNMLNDIDVLVEGVYRDRLDRANFHRQFLTFGFALYGFIILVQLMLSSDAYLALIEQPIVRVIVHGIVLINTFFLLKGEKYYNENVGAE